MLLALVMTFLGTTNVSAGWIQKFTDQGVDKDYNILFVDGADVKIMRLILLPFITMTVRPTGILTAISLFRKARNG